jgi:hypothetical protein
MCKFVCVSLHAFRFCDSKRRCTLALATQTAFDAIDDMESNQQERQRASQEGAGQALQDQKDCCACEKVGVEHSLCVGAV